MTPKFIFFIAGILFISSLSGINLKNRVGQGSITHYQYNSEGSILRLTVSEKEASSCEVDACGFTQSKTSCSITCTKPQIAKCDCNCIKTTTFGTCLELRESCKCEKD
jgi:hypothetical protein